MRRQFYRLFCFIAFAIGFMGALVDAVIKMAIEPFLVQTRKRKRKSFKWETVQDSRIRAEHLMLDNAVNFSCENLHRNEKYVVTLRHERNRPRVCYFDTMIRNGGKAMFCVFTEKRNGKGNVLVVATSVEIHSALPVNQEMGEKREGDGASESSNGKG